MNIVDILIVLVFVLFLWTGFRKGFIAGFLELAGWVGSIALGYFLYQPLAGLLHEYAPAIGFWSEPLSFIAIVLLARLVFTLLINSILFSTPATIKKNTVNRLMGLVPGLVNGLIYATLVVAILLTVPINNSITSATRSSMLAGKFTPNVNWANEKFAPIFDEAVSKTISPIPKETKPDETVILNYKVTDAKARPDLETRMLALVNEERAKAGLPPVKADPELTVVARQHSQDMFSRGYFSHYTLENRDPFDRMRAAKVKFLAAGENLALGQTLEICHKGLMNSPGHRANILHPSFGRLGIGILDGGIYGLMISQEFRN